MIAVGQRFGALVRQDPVWRWWNARSVWFRRAVVLAALVFAIVEPQYLSRYWQSVLFFPIGIYVLLALGLNVVVGMAGLLDLGYVAFYAVGAYATAVLTTTHGWGTWEALPVALLMAMIAGVLLGAPTLRLRGDYLAIVTLGFGEIVRIVALNTGALGESRGIVGIPHPESVGSLHFQLRPLPYYYVTLAAIVLAILMITRLSRSRVGRSWAALREDEDAAEAMGVHTFTMKLWAFAIGASTGGVAGWLYASKVGFVSPENFPFFFSVTIVAAVVLGGMGSIPGVIAGAAALAFLPEYLRNAAAGERIANVLHAIIGGPPANVTEYRVLLFGVAIVVMMILRPQGLLPSKRRAAELAAPAASAQLGGETGVEIQVDVSTTSSTAAPMSPGALLTPLPIPADGAPLVITNVSMRFGGVSALTGVSFSVERGEIFGIIGPNGAGKTTLFNCITGVFRPQEGTINLDDEVLVGKGARAVALHRITQRGVARTFQNIRLFPEMTALENVMVGADARHKTSVFGALFGAFRHRREEKHGRELATRLLAFVGIGALSGEAARNLSYGDQRRLEVARALATQPRVLLLDEPAAGMNPSEKAELRELVRRLGAAGLTVVVIEHDMGFVMSLCDRVGVLDFGAKIAEGTPEAVQADENVIRAYLGVPADAS